MKHGSNIDLLQYGWVEEGVLHISDVPSAEKAVVEQIVNQIINDCLSPESVGSKFIHEEVNLFAKQLAAYLNELKESQ